MQGVNRRSIQRGFWEKVRRFVDDKTYQERQLVR